MSALTTALAPGFYDVQLAGSSVQSSATGGMLNDGASFSETLYVAIPGDTNLDGVVTLSSPNLFTRVDTGDVAIARSNVGTTNATWAQGDFNGDGVVTLSVPNLFTRVNTGDVAVARANVGMDVRPPTAAASFSSLSLASGPEVSVTPAIEFESPLTLSVLHVEAPQSASGPLELAIPLAAIDVAPIVVAPSEFVSTVSDVQQEFELDHVSSLLIAPSADFVSYGPTAELTVERESELAINQLPVISTLIVSTVDDDAHSWASASLDLDRTTIVASTPDRLLGDVLLGVDGFEDEQPV